MTLGRKTKVQLVSLIQEKDETIQSLEKEIKEKQYQYRLRGRWLHKNGQVYCTLCAYYGYPIITPYCPNCGAKMVDTPMIKCKECKYYHQKRNYIGTCLLGDEAVTVYEDESCIHGKALKEERR